MNAGRGFGCCLAGLLIGLNCSLDAGGGEGVPMSGLQLWLRADQAGEMVMWLGAMDQRVQAAVITGVLTDMNQMESNHCMCWKFPGLRKLVDYADIYALIAPRMLMFQNAIDEPPTQFPPSVAVRVMAKIAPAYRDRGVPQNVALVVFPGGHEIHVPSIQAFFQLHLRAQ